MGIILHEDLSLVPRISCFAGIRAIIVFVGLGSTARRASLQKERLDLSSSEQALFQL